MYNSTTGLGSPTGCAITPENDSEVADWANNLKPYSDKCSTGILCGVVSNPAISSPGLNNVIFVDGVTYSQSDIGAGINAAYAAATNGSLIYVPAKSGGGCYSTSTPIVFATTNKEVDLRGAGVPSDSNAGTCINYVPTTASSALTIDWTPGAGGSFTPGAGVHDLMIENNGCTTNGGCGSSAIGINIGPTNSGAANASFSDLKIFGFGKGINVPDAGGQSWGMVFDRLSLTWNTTGYSQAKNEELITFRDPKILLNGTGFDLTGSAEISIFGGSIDSNSTCGVQTHSNTPILNFYGTHWENLNVSGNVNYICGGSASVGMFGGLALDDNATSSSSAWFTAGTFLVNGVTVFSGGQSLSGFLFVINDQADINIFDNSATALPQAQVGFCGGGTKISVIATSGLPFSCTARLGLSSGNLLFSATAPTISSGFGTSPSIVQQNGTAAFEVNVGTGGTATSGVIGLPTAANGWSCTAIDMNTNDVTRETAFTTATVTLTAASAWTASDKLLVNCAAF